VECGGGGKHSGDGQGRVVVFSGQSMNKSGKCYCYGLRDKEQMNCSPSSD
jgi:hypothetical protein